LPVLNLPKTGGRHFEFVPLSREKKACEIVMRIHDGRMLNSLAETISDGRKQPPHHPALPLVFKPNRAPQTYWMQLEKKLNMPQLLIDSQWFVLIDARPQALPKATRERSRIPLFIGQRKEMWNEAVYLIYQRERIGGGRGRK